MSAKKRSGMAAGLTNTIGGMLVGLDEQLLRGQPRVEILVKRGTQLRVERDAAGELVIELPRAGSADGDGRADPGGSPEPA